MESPELMSMVLLVVEVLQLAVQLITLALILGEASAKFVPVVVNSEVGDGRAGDEVPDVEEVDS